MRRNETQNAHGGSVTIRRLGEADHDAVRRVAQLDTRREPQRPWLGAEIEGRLLAVTSLAGGQTVADPFSRTAELRALLELRAKQIRQREAMPRGGRVFRRRARPAAALAGSPPGAGGRLLTLLPRF